MTCCVVAVEETATPVEVTLYGRQRLYAVEKDNERELLKVACWRKSDRRALCSLCQRYVPFGSYRTNACELSYSPINIRAHSVRAQRYVWNRRLLEKLICSWRSRN